MDKIAVVIGSLSRDSLNRRIANEILKYTLPNLEIVSVDISDLPLYTQDNDAINIPAYDRVRTQLKEADAVLIVSPEHNRSVPAALKNLLDIGSRPYGQTVWQEKKVAVVTASPSAYGGINAGVHLRQILQSLGANVLSGPEVYLSRASMEMDERTKSFLAKFANTFFMWIRSNPS